MKNFRFIVLALIATLCTSIWAQKTYTFDDGVALENDWTVELTGDGLTCTITDNIGGSLTTKDGKYMGFAFTKSNTTIAVTTKAAYTNITSIGIDLSANDNSKPSYSGYIVDDNGNVLETLFENIDSKNSFATGGAKKWGHKDTSVSSKTGHFKLSATTGSSGKYTAIDNITITYSDEGGGGASASSDATLKSIVYGTDATPLPGFASNKLDYNLVLPAGTIGAPSVQATANDEKANVNITQATSLPGTAKIEVTAEDGTTKLEYKVTFTVASNKPKVLNATWDNILDVAVIDNTGYTITGQVAHGSSLTLTPQFTGDYIASWTPSNAQDFSNGPVSYTFQSSTGETTTYAVTITEGAAPIEVTSIHLNKTSTSLYVGNSETLTVTYTPSDANTGKGITWSSDKESVATVDQNGKVTGVTAGTAVITATSEKGKTATCTVTVQAIAVTGVTLNKNSLTLKTGSSETLTATVLPSDAANKNVTWSSSDNTVATVENGKVTAVAEGGATITVTTEDGNKTATCNVIVQASSPLPDVGLVAHAPEKYEEPKGYNTPLSQFNGRDYEVYYVTRDPSGNNICIATNTDDKIAGISNGTATTVKARDNWFELKASGGKGGDGNAAAKDEFKLGSVQCIKMQSNQEMLFQVKGFDQFNFYGKDNNKDASKGKYFEVYIDGELQAGNPGSPIDGYAIHRYDMSTAEHVIRLVGIGASDSKLTGFSLRVSTDPLVRHVDGPKAQTAYQTKEIERVAFRVRRAANYRLVWKNNNAIPGVTTREGANDSVYVEGLANAAAGVYTYTIEALNSAGEVKSAESGTITIQTQIFDAAYGNDFTTNIDEAITPLNFIYYAMNSADIKLNCDIEGLQLTFSKDSIATLTGTPTLNNTEGEHTYTISAAGGNTISGVITIIVPDPYFESFADAKTRDRMAISFSVIARHAANVTATGLPEGFIVSYDASSNKATISGTPNIGSGYPKTFDFTLNATPRYAGKNESSASGKLIVIDPNATAVLVVVKDRDQISEDPIALYLNQDPNLKCDITHRKQALLAGSSYDMFDLVLISEDVDADHEDVLKLTRGLAESGRVNKPILNMKSFSYSQDRLDWGEPDNGSLSKEGCFITVVRDDHPIFKDWKKAGDKIQVLDTVIAKGLMPINIYQQGTLCLATSLTRSIEDYYGDGEMQTILHEIPASLSGGYKYICLPIARSSHSKLSADGKNLLKRIVQYLLSDQESVAVPTPEITKFTIDGVDGDINQIQRTITFDLDMSQHENLDLKNVVPQIELGGDLVQYAHVTPAQPSRGDTVDLSYSYIFPKEYIVSDYINRYIYEVTVNTYISDAIDHVYTAGDWVTVYDIFGRKLTVTNENIYTMDLPRGVYVIVTESGQTLKITK